MKKSQIRGLKVTDNNFKLFFENQVDSIEELILKINDGGNWDVTKDDLLILFDRYEQPRPFILMDFVEYARWILNLKRTM